MQDYGWVAIFVRKEDENPQILRNNYTYARNFYQLMLCFQRGLQTCLVIFQVSLITLSFLVVFIWNLLHSAEAYSIFPSCSLMCRASKAKKTTGQGFPLLLSYLYLHTSFFASYPYSDTKCYHPVKGQFFLHVFRIPRHVRGYQSLLVLVQYTF